MLGYCEQIEVVFNDPKRSFCVTKSITGYGPLEVDQREERSGGEKYKESQPKLPIAEKDGRDEGAGRDKKENDTEGDSGENRHATVSRMVAE